MANLMDHNSNWKVNSVLGSEFVLCTLTVMSVTFFTEVVKYGGVDIDTYGNIMSKMLLSQSYKSPMWCWRRLEKIKWDDHVRNEEILQRVKGDRNILQTITRREVKLSRYRPGVAQRVPGN